jgi:uncharacterized protein YfaS (alpha-2-macroglobulin family)
MVRTGGILRVAVGLCLAVTAAALFSLAGCKSGGKDARPEGGTAIPPVTAEALAPVFGTLGPEGVVPQRLVIELARPIAAADSSDDGEGAEAEGTELVLEPAVSGELRRTGPSTLEFVPDEPLPPGTAFTARLTQVRTEDGNTLKAPGDAWTFRFSTPRFALARVALAGVEYNARWADVDLVFSGPVDVDTVRERVNATITDDRGRPVPLDIARVEHPEPHVARLRVGHSSLRARREMRLALAAGVEPAEGDGAAPAGSGVVQLPEGNVVEMHAVYPSEGTSGFYVEVVCDDGAVEGRRYYWDQVAERGFGQLSTRCQFSAEELAERLHITPAVPFTTAPSGGGFRLFGNFARGTYAVRFDAGAKTLDGGVLRGDYETSFSVPARSAQVTFVAKGRYLPRTAWGSLPVRHLNVDEVTLSVRQVPPQNLVFWMSDDDSERADERTSDLVVEQKIPVRGAADTVTTSYVDVSRWVPADSKGLLELTLTGGGARDSARILLTDLQLVAKRTGVGRHVEGTEGGTRPRGFRSGAEGESSEREHWGDEVMVWAFDSRTLEPARGVDVQLLRRSGHALASCKTGPAGACTVDVPQDELDPSPPFALLAQSGRDLTYLKFDELEAEVEEARVAGEPYSGERKYRAAVYGDRGVYRPGETAHLVAIVRDARNVAPPAGMPVQVKLVDPRGKVIRQHTLTVNGAGMVTLDPTFAAFATTGRYQAQVEIAGDQVGSHSFRVEEFVPERMKVEARAAQARYLLGDAVEVGVDARYLFGGIPAGAPVELQCDLAQATFQPKQNANFVYGVRVEEGKDPEKAVPLGTVEGTLDDQGAATLACPQLSQAGTFRGPAKLVARAAVLEAGSGRTTVGETNIPVHPARFYIGLSSATQKVKAGEDLVVQGIVVDWDGKPVGNVGEVEVELLRLEEEYGWYYDEDLGDETWRRYLRPVPEDRTKVEVEGGRFRMTWRPQADAAGFLVQARAGAARTDLELEGDGGWYWWDPSQSEAERTPRPDRPTWIDITVPDKAQVGERVEVIFQAPFRGRVLLTAETDGVVASEWKDIEPGETRWRFELPKFVPNVYVTAFAVKDPRVSSEGGLLPDRAFGVVSLPVEPAEFTQPVTLNVPKEVRSATTLTVDLDLGTLDGPTWATVAAVDEGILSLTRFESPDPAEQIFTRRALGVDTFETVGWTLAVPPQGPERTGGDAAGLAGRVQPVKPVALWSGLVQVPASGKLRVTFDLPAYRGALRVMAVTSSPKRIGRADAQVIVRDPLVLQVTLPRFLALEDEIQVPVAVTNLSGASKQVTVTLAAEDLAVPGLERSCGATPCPPLVEVVGPAQRSLQIADGATGTAVFRARALGGIGGVALVARAEGGGVRSQERAELPVQPAAPRLRRVQRIELEAGTTDLSPHLEGWLPLTERTTIWVTANPYGEAFAHLKHLVHYPYGCVEQTTSTTRPLLYLAHLVGSLDAQLAAPGAIEKMVQSGIERVLSMQTPAGGFGYWPGDDQPAPWGTAYATHMLLDAQKLRYPVPQGRLDEALGWMEQRISNHYEKGGNDSDWYSSSAEPYMHYVLALGGRGRKARALRLVESFAGPLKNEQREQLYMLKAALYLAGDHRFERDLRNPDISPLTGYRETGWTFYSDLRMRGFMLSVYGDLFGRDPGGERLAGLVAGGLQGESERFTTQELAWGITGLGKRVEAGAKDFAPPVLTADGRRIAPQPLPAGVSSSDRSWDLPRASEQQISLEVPSKGEGKLWLILVSQGVPTDGSARYGSEGLTLSRRWLAADGAALAGGGATVDAALGDLAYVELTVRNTSGARLNNLALVDRLPAGWEIENPRLGRSDATPEWVDTEALWEADHMDLRDDRIEVFGHLDNGEERKVMYAVRAVTAGRFAVPSAEVEAMYDPRYWARVRGGSLEVAGPWADE